VRENATRYPLQLKLTAIQNALNDITSSPDSQGRKKSPRFYVQYLNNAAGEVKKSYLKTRGSVVASGAKKLSRSLSQRIVGTVGSGASTAPIGTSFSDIKDILEQVFYNIQSVESSWLVEFIGLGGLESLFILLDTIHKKPEK
jgi:hypothetical protein